MRACEIASKVNEFINEVLIINKYYVQRARGKAIYGM